MIGSRIERLLPSRSKSQVKRTELQSFLASLRDGAICIDPSRHIIEFNLAAEVMFGFGKEEVLWKPLEDVIAPPSLRVLYRDAMEHYFRTGESALLSQRFESEALRANGEIVHVEMSVTPLEEHEHALFLVMIRDIGERKTMESQLISQMKALERANQELKQFAHVASHDLQEPLRMITSFTQLLARRYCGTLDGEADKYIGYAVDGAKRMQGLIQALVSYSQSGREDIPLGPIESSVPLHEAIDNLKTTIDANGAQITHDALPTVYSDKIQLTQLFQNLLANAMKFCDGKSPRIHISAMESIEGTIFSVKDNGIGMHPEHLQKIFVIFQRLHDQTKYPGTGIGLSICKKIVDRHGGRIWVDSTPGKGSTFNFLIPRKG